jgi:hypothetical protein
MTGRLAAGLVLVLWTATAASGGLAHPAGITGVTDGRDRGKLDFRALRESYST